jgi:hypothetical protein
LIVTVVLCRLEVVQVLLVATLKLRVVPAEAVLEEPLLSRVAKVPFQPRRGLLMPLLLLLAEL